MRASSDGPPMTARFQSSINLAQPEHRADLNRALVQLELEAKAEVLCPKHL